MPNESEGHLHWRWYDNVHGGTRGTLLASQDILCVTLVGSVACTKKVVSTEIAPAPDKAATQALDKPLAIGPDRRQLVAGLGRGLHDRGQGAGPARHGRDVGE